MYDEIMHKRGRVHYHKHGITDLSHFHACRLPTSQDTMYFMLNVGILGYYVIR